MKRPAYQPTGLKSLITNSKVKFGPWERKIIEAHEQRHKGKELMKNEDPYNPFSSNYNGFPVGPDSFGGSDEESHYASNMSVEKIREELNKMKQESMSPRRPDLGDPEMIALKQIKNEIAQENMRKSLVIEEKDQKVREAHEPWIQTFSGKKFYPLNPREEDICIEDIAHALSMMCRYTGHVSRFYSVAEHSVLVSYVCDTQDALYGLLHDGSEYVLQDLPSPLKRSGKFEAYKEYEKTLQTMIYAKFGLFDEEPKSVKKADMSLFATESYDLMAPLHKDWSTEFKPLPFKVIGLNPKEAENAFIRRFKELTECK